MLQQGAKGVLIVGGPGSGKSSSMRNLNPKETFIINVQGKPLPFYQKGYSECVIDPNSGPSKDGNVIFTDNQALINNILKHISNNRPEIKTVIIDDFQYVAVNKFMRKIKEIGFDKFNEIGYDTWSPIATILKTLRKDLIVIFMSHDEVAQDETGRRFRRAKTMGKLVETQVGGIEGYFSYVFFTEVDGSKHYFLTNNEGEHTAKTPMGMFAKTDDKNKIITDDEGNPVPQLRIPNDLQLIIDKLK